MRSAVSWPRDCLKSPFVPSRSEKKITALLSTVHPNGLFHPSSNVSRVGVVMLVPLACRSATYTLLCGLHSPNASRLLSDVTLVEPTQKPAQFVRRRDSPI